MKAETVIEAARLLEQLGKLEAFLRDAPPDAANLTLTLRKGKHSKSVTLNNETTIRDIRSIVEDMRTETAKWVEEIGVELNERSEELERS